MDIHCDWQEEQEEEESALDAKRRKRLGGWDLFVFLLHCCLIAVHLVSVDFGSSECCSGRGLSDLLWRS